ncbi:hypothetical protein BCR35DRAFT_355144 [Leucosporidium creatinivorum]|uniref:RRM domain-containing protein n=1 Tax=Leucosporidium creatinivorum TaxID=106004 RepID=A0A1Y2DRL4_9BASI|nr:hypothetical protein BCR35DRAFT_355144 [Leucosporidium creatinivorum]
MAVQAAPSREQQQQINELVTNIQADDLAFALYYAELLLQSGGSVDWPSSPSNFTPLQAAVSTHGRLRVRKVIVEILLLSGATLYARVLELAEQGGNEEVIDTLKQWNVGGRARATLASEFLQIGAHKAEELIFRKGLGVEDTAEGIAEQADDGQVALAPNGDDDDMEMDSDNEDHVVKPEMPLLSRGPEPLDSTTSPAPKEFSRGPSPSVDAVPSRPPSPFVPHRLCISNIDMSMTEKGLIDVLTRVAGRIGNTRFMTTNSNPPTQTAYIDVGSSAARDRVQESWNDTHVNGRPLKVVVIEEQPSWDAGRRRGRARSTSRPRDGYEDRRPDWRRASGPPSQRPPSPRRRSRSPPAHRRSGSRRSSISSRRRSPSPLPQRRGPSPPPRRRSLSPRRSSGPPRRRSPSPRRGPRSPSPRNSSSRGRSVAEDPSIVFLSGLPPSVAERQLYEMVSAVVDVDHVRVRHAPASDIRHAFIAVRSRQDHELLIDHFRRLSHKEGSDLRASTKQSQSQRPAESNRERPYRTMELNLRPPADGIPFEVHISHLPPRTSRSDVFDLFESANVHPRIVQVKESSVGSFAHAFVTLGSLKDCTDAISRLDGEIVRGSGLCVEWAIPGGLLNEQPSPPRRRPSPPRRPRTPSPQRRAPPLPPRQPRPLTPSQHSSPPTEQSSTSARVVINRVPDDMAERQLFDLVSRHADVADVRVLHSKTSRFAFVELTRHGDVTRVIQALDDHLLSSGHRISVARYQDDRELKRPLNDVKRIPYRGAARNSQPPDQPVPRLLFSHVPPAIHEEDFRRFLRQASFDAGRVKIVQTRQNTQSIFVDLPSVEACRDAVRALDGAVLEGHALLAMWAMNTLDRPQTKSTASRNGSQAPSAALSRLSTTPAPTPRPPIRPASPTLEETMGPLSSCDLSPDAALARDISRIECLNLTLDDIDLIQQAWKPLPHPPTDDFTRSVEISASFGYLSPSEAKAALESPPLYSDSAKQARYETFLRAQMGDSRDRYMVFLAQLAQFNASNLEFVNFAQDVARTASPPPPPQPHYDPDPTSKDYTVAAADFGPRAPPRERKRSFEVSSRVERAFSR